MPEENIPENNTGSVTDDNRSRPLGLSLLLIFSFVYNGILALIMLLGLFYPQVIQNILQQYFKQSYISGTTAVMFTIAGVLIFGISFTGLILLWMYKRKGFYFYASAQGIMLIILVFVFHSYDYINIAIALIVLAIFGLYARNMK